MNSNIPMAKSIYLKLVQLRAQFFVVLRAFSSIFFVLAAFDNSLTFA
jgi:hypothetical protein